MAHLSRSVSVILLSAILFACAKSDDISHAAAKYDILPNERMHYEICVDDMKNLSLSFRGGATTTNGCACATKLILSEVENAQMPIIWDYRHVEKIVDPERYEFVAKKHSLSSSEADRVYRIVKTAFKLCEKKSFHTQNMVAQISALKPRSLVAQKNPVTATPKLGQNGQTKEPTTARPLQLRGRSKG